MTKDRILPLGNAEKAVVGNKDQNQEEELLSPAIALLEENDNEEDEEELLRQAIALSLADEVQN